MTPARVDAGSITVKGTILKSALAFVETRYGKEGATRLADELEPAVRDTVFGLVVPSARYPLRHLVALLEETDRVFGAGNLALCWEIGRFAGEYQVKTLHKIFLNVAKIDYWFRAASATWRFYYSAGTLTPEVAQDEGSLSLSEFDPISKAFCYRFGGWVESAMKLAKIPDAKVRHTECLLDSRPACVWHGTWGV